MKEYDELKRLILDVEPEVAKADAGNKASIPRVRKAMQAIKTAAQTLRVNIMHPPAAAAPTNAQ